MKKQSKVLAVSRMTSKGQITIPKKVREGFGLKVGDVVAFRIEGTKVIVSKGERKSISALLTSQEIGKEKGVHFQRRLRKEWRE